MIELFLPKTRRGILGLLVLHPGESFYLREIVRAVRGSPGTVQRELRALTKAGILTREKRGIQTYYRLREDCPILPEIRGMLLKTTGLVEVLRTALRGLQGVHLAFVYGSFAQGDAGPDSDVDVLVVGDVTFARVCECLWPAQEQLRREINPTVYAVQEFTEKVAAGHEFLSDVLQHDKLFVVGDPDVLRGLASGGTPHEAAPNAGAHA